MGLVLRKGIYQKKINYQLSDIGYIANLVLGMYSYYVSKKNLIRQFAK